MRLLLLSDIHGNLEALEACLAAAPPHDAVANLGDVVGYGASPNQVVERVRDMASIHIRGNHDRCCCGLEDLENFNPVAAAAARWTNQQLSEANREWLRALPSGPLRDADWDEVQFVHGSPLDEDEYIASEFAAEAALQAAPFRLTFFGHTHIQGAYARLRLVTEKVTERLTAESLANESDGQPARITVSRIPVSRITVSRLTLATGVKYLVNPGSVGQPRDSDRRAAFALYDGDAAEVRFYRVPYDIARAQQKILAAGLPPVLATRLEDGR